MKQHGFAIACMLLLGTTGHTVAGVTAEEAARLKTELTPFGAERAGNKDGSIPAWTGGYTTPVAGFKNGGRRGDPFANEKPLYSVTADNMAQHAGKLTEGTQALLKKYPKTFRVDVYKTHRTAAAPQWVYDNTTRNAVSANLKDGIVTNAFGGIPFPVPKTGEEVIANHTLRWRGEAWQSDFEGYLTTANGQRVLTVAAVGNFQMPFYANNERDKFQGDYWLTRIVNSGPPVRAGEAITGRENVDPAKGAAWVYLTGQRRVRKLPKACCDTPTPATSGVMSFDEVDVFTGRTDRFDWKLVGKQEMLIPYNANRLHTPKSVGEVLLANHLNPDHVRWELHRVWVVEATVKPGERHQAPKSRYYVDEDTWVAVLGDRWDANGQLWKTLWSHPVVMPDLPATVPQQQFGFNDLVSGAWYANGVVNERDQHYKIVPRRPDSFFTPDAMAADGVR
ncbi:LolA_like domain containing protein [Comamonadaceae bacterium]